MTVTFLHIGAAYINIDHIILTDFLLNEGIQTNLVALIYNVISDRNILLFPNLNKNEFRRVGRGISQGPLSPIFFNF